MVDINNKNNAIKENKQSFEDSSPSRRNFHLMTLVFILGIAVFAALYLNFQTSYKSDQSSLDTKESSLSEPRIDLKLSDVNVESQQIHQSNKVLGQKQTDDSKTIVHSQCAQSCLPLLQFTQDYLLLKNYVLADDDFANQLTILMRYTVNSEELKQNLVSLLNLSKYNHSYKYFKEQFKGLIKPIYKYSKQLFTVDVINYIFIRKINNRALESDDLDKIVFLISQALENNNLISAYENLKKLPQDIESINVFSQEIENKINIQNNIANIENILLNKPDCSIVSK